MYDDLLTIFPYSCSLSFPRQVPSHYPTIHCLFSSLLRTLSASSQYITCRLFAFLRSRPESKEEVSPDNQVVQSIFVSSFRERDKCASCKHNLNDSPTLVVVCLNGAGDGAIKERGIRTTAGGTRAARGRDKQSGDQFRLVELLRWHRKP